MKILLTLFFAFSVSVLFAGESPLTGMHCFEDVGISVQSFPIEPSESVRVYYEGNALTLKEAETAGLINAPEVQGDDGVIRWAVTPIQKVCVGRIEK